jgi:hypothetical protein
VSGWMSVAGARHKLVHRSVMMAAKRAIRPSSNHFWLAEVVQFSHIGAVSLLAGTGTFLATENCGPTPGVCLSIESE